MTRDPIIEEVRAIREAQAGKFGFDPKKILSDAKQREVASGRKVVAAPARPKKSGRVARVSARVAKRA